MSPRSCLSISKMCAAPWSYAGAQGGLEAFPSVWPWPTCTVKKMACPEENIMEHRQACFGICRAFYSTCCMPGGPPQDPHGVVARVSFLICREGNQGAGPSSRTVDAMPSGSLRWGFGSPNPPLLCSSEKQTTRAGYSRTLTYPEPSHCPQGLREVRRNAKLRRDGAQCHHLGKSLEDMILEILGGLDRQENEFWAEGVGGWEPGGLAAVSSTASWRGRSTAALKIARASKIAMTSMTTQKN